MMNELFRNRLTALLVIIAAASIVGTAVYWFFGWPTSEFPLREFFFVRVRDEWFGSPWQLLPRKEFAFTTVAIIAAAVVSVQQRWRWWHGLVIFFAVAWLLATNTRAFPLGFGYDIFVHDATVRAWIEHGAVTPRTFLYNGYHAIVAALAQLTAIRPMIIMMWLIPALCGALLAFAAREQKKRWPFILAIGVLFPTIFTTATPQAFGLLMLLGYTLLSAEKKLPWHAHAIIVAGIALIHPLSGIPAGVLAVFLFVQRWQSLRVIVTCVAACAPALALIIFTGADISRFTFPTFVTAFNPSLVDLLLSYWTYTAPVIFVLTAAYGYSRDKQNHALTAVVVAASGVPLFFLKTNGVIGYEQSTFAWRLVLAGALIAVPLAVHGVTRLWGTVQRTRMNGSLWMITGIVLVTASWYNAHEPWNTITRTRARQLSPSDIAIVRAIDADADAVPYIVLADQITSAGALHEFGFTHRTLPARPEYFYPIPTGGFFYQNYFLPSMYEKISRERLNRAANSAGVHRVYVVLKPYWRNRLHMDDELKQNTSSVFAAGGALIGQLDVP